MECKHDVDKHMTCQFDIDLLLDVTQGCKTFFKHSSLTFATFYIQSRRLAMYALHLFIVATCVSTLYKMTLLSMSVRINPALRYQMLDLRGPSSLCSHRVCIWGSVY